MKRLFDCGSGQGLAKTLFGLLTCGLLFGCGGSGHDAPDTMVSSNQNSVLGYAPANNVVVLNGPRNNFTLTRTYTGFHVKDNVGVGGIIFVSNQATLRFSDVTVNLGIADVAQTVSPASLTTLIELYIAFFNRVPDADGLAYWIAQVNAGMSTDILAQNFYNAAIQFSDLTGYSSTMSNADFVKVIYKNVLGRDEVDQDGLDYWSNALASGAQTRASLIKTILDAAHGFKGAANYGWVADLLDNKIATGRYFAIEQGLNYLNPEDSIKNTIAIVAKITPTDVSAARQLVNMQDLALNLSDQSTLQDNTKVVVSLDIPETMKLRLNGTELKAKTSIFVRKGSALNFEVILHPGFSWIDVAGVSYANNMAYVQALVNSDRILQFATPKVSDPNKAIIFSASYDRTAIYRDEIGKTAMRIEAFALVPAGDKLVLSYRGLDPQSKQEVTRELLLLDDGVGADKRAQDHHFSAELKTDLLPLYEYMGIAAYDGKIRISDANGVDIPGIEQVKTGMSMVVVDRAKTVPVTRLADDVFASKSVVNVVLQGSPMRFNWADGQLAPAAFKRVLAYYPDVFDHATFFYVGNVGPFISAEFSYRLNSQIGGIGNYQFAIMGDAAKYGSNILDSASELTGGATGPYMHEFTHRFGFYLNDPRLPMTESDGCKCHFDMWNQIIWDPISAGGGTWIRPLGNGDWVFSSYQGIYKYQHSDLMLYLMGLMAPAELPPQPWVVDATGKLAQGQTIAGSKVKVLNVADIEAVYGKRTPEFGKAPTSFRDAFVVITSGRPALPEEMAAVEAQANFYASRGSTSPNLPNAGWQNGLAFFDSTRGRGTLITELPAKK